MENQSANQNAPKNASGFNPLDIVALVSAAGGTVASVVSQQATLMMVAVPLSASVALHVFNRKQLMQQMAETQQAALAQLSQQITQQINSVQGSIAELSQFQQKSNAQLTKQTQAHQTNLETISGQIAALGQSTSSLVQKTQQLKETTESQQTKHEELEFTVLELKEIQEITQKMSANPNSGEFYFQRGFSQERLGDKQKALEDYNEAVKIDPTHANAYFHRGMINKDAGYRKMAVDDLRKAAKYYLEQGDIENYQKARNLSQGMHDFRSAAQAEHSEPNNHARDRIAVNGLFS